MISRFITAAIANAIRGVPSPLILLLEPSQRCNARCSFCYHWREENDREMSPATALRVLEEAWELGCRVFYFSGGEPTLYAPAESLLARARALGYRISMTTNGSRLEKQLPALAPYLDSVTVSIDYAGPRHDESRHYPGLYQQAVAGLLAARRHHLATRINMSLQPDNVHDVQPLLQTARETGAGLHVRLLTRESRELEVPAFTPDEAAREALNLIELKHLFPTTLMTPEIYFRTIAEQRPFVCRPLSLLVTVDSAGRLFVPCPRWEGTKERIAGNVHDTSLTNAWFSPAAEAIRRDAAKCRPSLDCYTSCILDISLLAGLDGAMISEQLLAAGSLMRYFLPGKGL